MPHAPHTPCTEMAPTGSSILSVCSRKSAALMTSTPATSPMSTAEGAVTNAHGAARCATRPPSIPVAHHRHVERFEVDLHVHVGRHRARRGRQHRIDRDDGDARVRAGERGARVEAEPAEREDERPEHHEGHAMAGDRLSRPVRAELALTWTQLAGEDECHPASCHAHHRAPPRSRRARARVQSWRRAPRASAAPYPVGEDQDRRGWSWRS